ncbi:MAG: ATP-binding cassette domain-containing protein, partial [Planctomycetia bacterium]
GGNQQKVALARLLAAQSQLFLLDEPTRGVDVRAKSEIYRWIDTIASEQRGGALLVSSYAPELLGVCDSIRVMQAGALGAARPASEWTQEQLVEAAFGAERAA